MRVKYLSENCYADAAVLSVEVGNRFTGADSQAE